MTQEEKQILSTDLCARLMYRVKCFVPVENRIMELTGKRLNYFCFHKEEWGYDYSHEFEVVLDPLNDSRNRYIVKPYLRPMSSMTEEEKEELIKNFWGSHTAKDTFEELSWYLSKHFDINELIPRGLAIEVTEENNHYKE